MYYGWLLSHTAKYPDVASSSDMYGVPNIYCNVTAAAPVNMP